MSYKTRLDFGSNNRQAKQHQYSEIILSGKTTFGVTDYLIPPSFTGDTINIEARQFIKTKGLIIVDGTQQDGLVLTSDANGKATWQSVSAHTFNDYVTGATFNNEIIEFTRLSGGTFNVDLSNTYSLTGHTHDEYLTGYTDNFITGATFNVSDGVLTLSELTGGTVTVDLDGRYLTSETDSQTLSFSAVTGNLEISNGNIVNLDGRYQLSGATPDLSAYVPYTGATQNLDLSGNSISMASIIGPEYNTILLEDNVNDTLQRTAILTKSFSGGTDINYFSSFNNATWNWLNIGGGITSGYAMTDIEFYIAPTVSTLEGNVAMALNDAWFKVYKPLISTQSITGTSFVKTTGLSTEFLMADGSVTTGTTSSAQSATHTQSGASTTWVFTHNLNELHPIIQVWDENDDIIIPQNIRATDVNTITITFSTARTGSASAMWT